MKDIKEMERVKIQNEIYKLQLSSIETLKKELEQQYDDLKNNTQSLRNSFEKNKFSAETVQKNINEILVSKGKMDVIEMVLLKLTNVSGSIK